MDNKTIFVLTPKGEAEVSKKTMLLHGDIKRALSMVDGESTLADITKRAAPSLRSIFTELIKELSTGGFIQNQAKAGFDAKIAAPKKPSKPDQSGTGELDFTISMRAPSADVLRTEAAKIQAGQKAKQEAESAKLKAEQDAAAAKQEAEKTRLAQEHEARLKAVQEAEAQEEAKYQQLAESAKQKAEADAKAQQAADAARLKAEQEAAKLKQDEENARLTKEYEVRVKAVQEAKAKEEAMAKDLAEAAKQKAAAEALQAALALRVKAEQEALKVKQAAEQLAKEQAEAARLKAEQEARLKAEAEAKAKQEAERRAKEAEAARLKAVQDAERARIEEGIAKQKAEAEEKSRKEAERLVREQAEVARLKAEQDVRLRVEAQAKQEAEALRIKAERESLLAREEAERRAREQAEAARLQAEQDAARVRAELEASRIKAEVEAKIRAEAEAKIKQEAEAARLKAERDAAKALEEARRIKELADAQAKAAEEAARKAKQEAETARLKAERDAEQARLELEAVKLKAERESQARLEAEAARLAAEHEAIVARAVAEQLAIQDRDYARQIEEQTIKAREEEQQRLKQQQALAAASTQVRDTPYETSKPPEFRLDAINLDKLAINPEMTAAVRNVAPPIAPPPAAVQAAEPVESAEERKAKELALKEQIREAEEARIEEEAAARKQADAQARAWAEAEQRAAAAAKAHVNHLTYQSAQSAETRHESDKKLRKSFAKRKPLPWGGIAIGLVVVALLAAFLVPMLLPTQEYAAQLEKLLAEKLQQPVHIGKLSGRILPTPRLDLGEIYIGEIKQIKAQQAQLSFGFGALFSEVKPIDSIELEGAELNGKGLLDVPVWLQKLSADRTYPITRIVFNLAKLNGDAVQLGDLEGEVNFSQAGLFSNAVLRANSAKYVLDIKATPAGKLETTFNLHGSALPLLPNWNFDDLTAKGELTRDGFVVDDFDGRIAGGVLQGKARLDWKSGWSAQGTLTAKTMSLPNLNKLLEGDLDGDARFKMQSDVLARLPDAATLEGNFVAKKGVINGVDIVETARLHSKEKLPGGRTHFDEIDSAVTYSNNAYHFKSLKITNSVLSSTGSMDVVKQQLSGRLSAHLSITEGMGTVDLQVSGAVDNPSLRAAR